MFRDKSAIAVQLHIAHDPYIS